MTRSLKRSEISSGNEKRLECSQRWHEDTGWEAKCEIQFMLQLPLIWYHFSQITRTVYYLPPKTGLSLPLSCFSISFFQNIQDRGSGLN